MSVSASTARELARRGGVGAIEQLDELDPIVVDGSAL
jgi:hypothetical protein